MGEGSSRLECPDCGRVVQEKNIRKHYVRMHPGLDPYRRIREARESRPRRKRLPRFDIKTSPVVPVFLTAFVVVILIIAGLLIYSLVNRTDEPPEARKIFYAASDGAVINATFYEAVEPGAYTIFLIHDLGQDRTIWDQMAERIRDSGYNVLAMDLRGHGESTKNLDGAITYDWTTMTDDQMYRITRDLEAAVKWLRGTDDRGNKNTEAGDLGSMVGLGRGGLIAWDQASRMSRPGDDTIKFVSSVLISPVLDCPGIDDVLQIAENWGDIRPVMFAGGTGDGNSVIAIEDLMERRPENGLEVKVDSNKKGIDILEDHREVRTSMYETFETGFEL
ncbi:MAG: alpha/beta hydrolase [Thermoplasmatota archaeon]